MKAFGKIGVLLVLASLTLWACEGHHASGDKTTVSKVEKQDGKLPTVVVKPFSAKGITDDQASGLASKFCVELSKQKGFNLLCAEDLRALFSHKGDQVMLGQSERSDCLAELAEKTKANQVMLGKCESSDCQAKLAEKTKADQAWLSECERSNRLTRLAEKTKADKILQIVVSKVGEKFVVTVIVVEGPTGTIKSRLAHELDSGAVEDLLDAMTPLAVKVGELL